MSINKQVVIVTGCSSGIGKCTAEKYINEGFSVIGFDLNPCELEGDFTYYQVDLTNEEAVDSVFNILADKGISIRYLINCAGIFYKRKRCGIADMDSEEWSAVLNNNLNSCMYVVRNAIALFEMTAIDRAIVFVSSDQVDRPRKNNGAYATSKGAINTFSKMCAVELLEMRVRVNVVEAASVETNFIFNLAGSEEHMKEIYAKENEKMPLGIINPEDVAEIIYFLGSKNAKKITGQTILLDSGLYI